MLPHLGVKQMKIITIKRHYQWHPHKINLMNLLKSMIKAKMQRNLDH